MLQRYILLVVTYLIYGVQLQWVASLKACQLQLLLLPSPVQVMVLKL